MKFILIWNQFPAGKRIDYDLYRSPNLIGIIDSIHPQLCRDFA